MQRNLISMVVLATMASACEGGADDGSGGSESSADASSGEESSGDESSSGDETGPGVMPTLPDVTDVEFVDVIDNPFMPMPVGMHWEYEAMTEEGVEHIDITVTEDTRTIQGVVATVVRDTATLNGEVIEDTWDWFAQDALGNVWYLGEDTCEFEMGMCVDHVGAWEWGKDGALPGIVMPAVPTVDGQPYYEEFYPGEAEDAGEVIETDVHVDVPAGSFDGCIKTRETSTLDPTLQEYKYWCPGIGLTLTEEEDVSEELTVHIAP